jgi:Spy/CpxP family protein refolding chaperone
LDKRVLTRFMIASSIALAVPLTSYGDAPSDAPEGRYERPHSEGPRSTPEDGRLPRTLRDLDLSEEQRGRISHIFHAWLPALREQAQALRRADRELRAMARSGRFDRDRAVTLAQTGARARAAMVRIRAWTEDQVFQALGPEQRRRLQAWKARIAWSRGPEDGPGGGRGRG